MLIHFDRGGGTLQLHTTCHVFLKMFFYLGMGYVEGTTDPKVLQEREVEKIDPHSCFLRRYPNEILPVWLGHGSCFIGHNGEAGYMELSQVKHRERVKNFG